VATCLDAQNVQSLPGITPREVEAAWMHVQDILVVLIDKTRAADESMRTYVTDDDESVDWLAAASLASSHPVNKSSSNIADKEIALWRMRLQALLSPKDPLTELKCTFSVVPWITLLGRKVLAVLATSAVPERMFSAAGNIMTKKQPRFTCDHLEEPMYLHEVWLKVREWMAIKKTRLVYCLHVTHTRAHTHKHTHSYTKNPLDRIPCFFVVTNNKYQKEIAFISETLSPCCTHI